MQGRRVAEDEALQQLLWALQHLAQIHQQQQEQAQKPQGVLHWDTLVYCCGLRYSCCRVHPPCVLLPPSRSPLACPSCLVAACTVHYYCTKSYARICTLYSVYTAQYGGSVTPCSPRRHVLSPPHESTATASCGMLPQCVCPLFSSVPLPALRLVASQVWCSTCKHSSNSSSSSWCRTSSGPPAQRPFCEQSRPSKNCSSSRKC